MLIKFEIISKNSIFQFVHYVHMELNHLLKEFKKLLKFGLIDDNYS